MRYLFLIVSLFVVQIATAQGYILRQQAIADIDFMIKTIEEVHYNPYLFISKEEFYKKAEATKRSIGDSIEWKAFLRKLYPLTASLKDGHTAPAFVQTILRPQLVTPLFAPFSFVTDEKDKVFVANNTIGGLQMEDEILAVNGRDASALAKEIYSFYGGLDAYTKDLSNKLYGYQLYLTGVVPPFILKYKRGNEVKEITIDSALTYPKALALSLPGMQGKNYYFKELNNKIGYIDFTSMSDLNRFSAFMDSTMGIMIKKNIPVLVVDLRKNSGGNSVLGDLLLSYITRKEYTLMGGRYWKISQQYKDYLIAGGRKDDTYLTKEVGSVWELGDCKPYAPKFKVDSLYQGKVYFITGPFTFSSANMLADGVKQFKLATIIGEPTGERTNDFGEVLGFQLPNSKIGINVTTSYDIGADCNKQSIQSVQPDILIKTTTAQKLKGIDPVMDYILIKEK